MDDDYATAIVSVVLDAANIAARERGDGSVDWDFDRVMQVRRACALRWPTARIMAFIDASAAGRLTDRREFNAATQEGWIEIAPGDADDLMLGHADRTGALVVSRDNFIDARRTYRWLDEEPQRVWLATWRHGDVALEPRFLRPVSDEEVNTARRNKAKKAGRVSTALDEVWICTSSPARCQYGGQRTNPVLIHKRHFCQFCSEPAEEQIVKYMPTGRLAHVLVLIVDEIEVDRIKLPERGLVIGRGAPSRPEVTDVTTALDSLGAHQISRRHLRVELDDDGHPTAVHLSDNGVSFLNPHFDETGLPTDRRLRRLQPYPLVDSDELVLGGGRVRLIVSADVA
ncbi:hypothetical protein [Nocardia niigatensis]